MTSSEDLTEYFHTLFEGKDIKPVQVDLSDDIKTVKCDFIDEAYECMLREDEPKFYSLSRENNGVNIWYKFRYLPS